MELVSNYLDRFKYKNKVPPHEQAAKVDEIVKIVGLSNQYPYEYWLRKVKSFSFGQILDICKEANNLDKSKYNVGGFMTNKLCRKNSKK